VCCPSPSGTAPPLFLRCVLPRRISDCSCVFTRNPAQPKPSRAALPRPAPPRPAPPRPAPTPQATLKKLAKYIADPVMAIDNVSKVSKAASSLCMWVHAMDVYSKVAKEVEPKRQRLKEMNDQLNEANTLLLGKQAELQAVLDRVAALRAMCDQTLAEKERLAYETDLTKKRLVRADKLTNGLADEQVRWGVGWVWAAGALTVDVAVPPAAGSVPAVPSPPPFVAAWEGKRPAAHFPPVVLGSLAVPSCVRVCVARPVLSLPPRARAAFAVRAGVRCAART
jgi:hypothetical protein